MTTVTNQIVNPVGVPQPNIVVVVQLLPATTAAFDGVEEVVTPLTTRTDGNGTWTLHLIPNASITPSGTTYQVTHYLTSGNVISNFIVPVDGATPVTHNLSSLVI